MGEEDYKDDASSVNSRGGSSVGNSSSNNNSDAATISNNYNDHEKESSKPAFAGYVAGSNEEVEVRIASATFAKSCSYFVSVQCGEGEKVRTEVCKPATTPAFTKRIFTFIFDGDD